MELEPIKEFDTPYPRRYRWLVRLGIAYALLIAMVVGAWFWWDATSVKRLDAEIARLRANGQMVLVSDFNARPKLNDDQNAALLYQRAWNFSYNADQKDFEDKMNWDVRLTPKLEATLHTFPIDFVANLQLMRQARQLNQADFGTSFSSPMIKMAMRPLNNVRSLANLTAYSADAFHFDGNDAEAVESVRDVLHLADMLDSDGHTIVEHLVAIGCNALACSRAETMAPKLAIDSSIPPHRHATTRPATQPAKPASRAQVQALIADLLDDRPLQRGLEESLKGERALQIDSAQFLANGGSGAMARAGFGPSTPGTALIGPIFRTSGVRLSQRMSQRLEAAQTAKTLMDIGKRLPYTELQRSNSTSLTNATTLLERILEPSMGRFFETHFRILAQRRATAIKLAMRLYQADHAGKYPASLDELVPTYLSAVPTDPYAHGSRPMGYVASMEVDGVMTPVIYSVASDGVDGKASTRPTRPTYSTVERTVHENPWEREDLLFPLIPPRPGEPAPPDALDATMVDPSTDPAATQPSP